MMSELTKERLEEIADEPHNFSHINYSEVQQAVRELLSLRAIRDASDEEVSDLRTVICSGIWSNTKQKQEAADVAVDSIVSKVFFLREQLREAREENNRYHDEAQVSDSLVLTLQEEVKMLTKERDEARKEVAWQKKKVRNLQMAADSAGRVDLLSQIATLTTELAALKSAPGMAEVDAMGKSAMETLAQIVRDRPETNRPAIDTVPAGRYAKLRDLIDAMLATCCRSIAAREEVVGLLKHILSCIITVKQENTPEWMEYIAEEVNKINEAIGDPDRVVVNCCDIVIVRGKSEIVEGK